MSLLSKIKEFFTVDELEDVCLDNLVLYLTDGVSLPAPLAYPEEVETCKRMEQGDMKARAELIEKNLRLVVFIAKKFMSSGHPMDDLISIGSIGLIKAINSYKLDKQIKLATYASRCIENEILMYLRKTQKEKREVSLDEPIRTDSDGSELVLAELIKNDNEETDVYKNVEEEASKQILRNSILTLNAREQEIITLRFGLNGGDEKTQKEVADFLNISQSYISRLEKKIIDKLKDEIKKRREA